MSLEEIVAEIMQAKELLATRNGQPGNLMPRTEIAQSPPQRLKDRKVAS